MKLRILLTIIISCYTGVTFLSQVLLPINNDFVYFIENSAQVSDKFHTSIRPFNIGEIQFDSSRTSGLNLESYSNKKGLGFYPIIESSFSVASKKEIGTSLSAGIGLCAHLGQNWTLQLNMVDNLSRFPEYIGKKIDTIMIVPHYGRYLKRYGRFYHYPDITGVINFTFWNSITLSAGVDKNFIGDGYRSLLLSDNSASYPMAKLVVHAWKLKYIALWARIDDILSYSNDNRFHEKYVVLHYLSLNATDRINLGFFESIVWAGNDSSGHRGFEPSYLNPVIFYRPVEFSQNSPDNANMGGSFKIRFWKRTFFYGQLFIDDFIVSQFKANNGWWGNKYSIQTGVKSFNFANINGLFVLAEYNFARPYTYSHNSSLNNYGYLYQPLAHPLGANFDEIVFISKYQYGKWLISVKMCNAFYGADSAKTSYGSDIYKPYSFRNSDYNINTLQGLKTQSLLSEIRLSYFLKTKWNISLNAGYRLLYRNNTLVKNSDNFVFIGISTLFNNNESDY
jgi:hypothetical protein